MAYAAPIFFNDAVYYLDRILQVAFLIIEVFAFINCLTQRGAAFPAIGTLPKGAWLAIIGGSVLVTLLFNGLGLLAYIAITATALYLLDVRPALRGTVDGSGSW